MENLLPTIRKIIRGKIREIPIIPIRDKPSDTTDSNATDSKATDTKTEEEKKKEAELKKKQAKQEKRETPEPHYFENLEKELTLLQLRGGN